MSNNEIPNELTPKIKDLGFDFNDKITYEDFFEWVRDTHKIFSFVSVNINRWISEVDNYYYHVFDIKNNNEYTVHSFKTYGEAKKASLLKIVDIIKKIKC